MLDETEPSALHRFEQVLARSVREFASRLRQERQAASPFDGVLLRRLGIDGVSVDDLLLPSRLAPGLRTRILDRLDEENRRLVRLARRAAPAYDLNRHIAVRRLTRRIQIGAMPDSKSPLSGAELNARFARRVRRRPVAA